MVVYCDLSFHCNIRTHDLRAYKESVDTICGLRITVCRTGDNGPDTAMECLFVSNPGHRDHTFDKTLWMGIDYGLSFTY